MITKEQLLASIRHETNVIKHVATKVPEGRHDWRPTPGQRSIAELMRYLSVAALSPAVYCATGNWDHAEGLAKECEAVTPENFAGVMDRQLARIEEVFDGIDEQAATTAPSAQPWGAPVKQSQALMDSVLKTLVAYRMQLFLYAKQAGNADIGPADCWAGVSSFQ
jgi:hypothetical protein